nr:hypothetical protein [uncultured Nocardioides sp.]
MLAMILISTAAILVAIVGCAVIWRMDALRADEIENTRPPERPRPQLAGTDDSLPASLPAP